MCEFTESKRKFTEYIDEKNLILEFRKQKIVIMIKKKRKHYLKNFFGSVNTTSYRV